MHFWGLGPLGSSRLRPQKKSLLLPFEENLSWAGQLFWIDDPYWRVVTEVLRIISLQLSVTGLTASSAATAPSATRTTRAAPPNPLPPPPPPTSQTPVTPSGPAVPRNKVRWGQKGPANSASASAPLQGKETPPRFQEKLAFSREMPFFFGEELTR